MSFSKHRDLEVLLVLASLLSTCTVHYMVQSSIQQTQLKPHFYLLNVIFNSIFEIISE